MRLRMTYADLPHLSFRGWLLEQQEREDPVGDLAKDIRDDPCLGQKRTPQALLIHMQSEHDAGEPAIEAFKRALDEWQGETNRVYIGR